MDNQQASKNKKKYRKHGRDINHPNFPHNTSAGYRAECRCEGCVIAHRLHKKEYIKKLRETNPKYKEAQREDKRKYRKTEKGKALYNSMSALHRQRKIQQTPKEVSHDILRKIYEYCPKDYHVDHIIPISLGGKHEPDNLQYLPKEINLKKSSSLDFDYSKYSVDWRLLIFKASTTRD